MSLAEDNSLKSSMEEVIWKKNGFILTLGEGSSKSAALILVPYEVNSPMLAC